MVRTEDTPPEEPPAPPSWFEACEQVQVPLENPPSEEAWPFETSSVALAAATPRTGISVVAATRP